MGQIKTEIYRKQLKALGSIFQSDHNAQQGCLKKNVWKHVKGCGNCGKQTII